MAVQQTMRALLKKIGRINIGKLKRKRYCLRFLLTSSSDEKFSLLSTTISQVLCVLLFQNCWHFSFMKKTEDVRALQFRSVFSLFFSNIKNKDMKRVIMPQWKLSREAMKTSKSSCIDRRSIKIKNRIQFTEISCSSRQIQNFFYSQYSNVEYIQNSR